MPAVLSSPALLEALGSWVYLLGLLGGPWDLVTTIITGIIPLLISGVTPISIFRGIVVRVISPVISSYYVSWASKS